MQGKKEDLQAGPTLPWTPCVQDAYSASLLAHEVRPVWSSEEQTQRSIKHGCHVADVKEKCMDSTESSRRQCGNAMGCSQPIISLPTEEWHDFRVEPRGVVGSARMNICLYATKHNTSSTARVRYEVLGLGRVG
jgi:hypothetical protein